MQTIECCFCGNKILRAQSNNPWPLRIDDSDRCCSDCNWSIVLPARIEKIMGWDGDSNEAKKNVQ